MPALGTMMNFVFIYLWGFHSFLNEYDYVPWFALLHPAVFQYSLVGLLLWFYLFDY